MAESQETTNGVNNTRSTQATSSTPSTDRASLFGVGQPTFETTTSASLKRKTTDTNLDIVTIDSMYDLTLIVGSTEHVRGQKAFRVSKSSFRNASNVWTSMLSGKWAEGDMSEIRFPDDSCYAFQIVLQIAHWQFHMLPETLTQQELMEVALFSDKYDLGKVIHTAAELKKWLQPYKGAGTAWPLDISLQDFAFITAAFEFSNHYTYFVSRLAVEIDVTKSSHFYLGSGGEKVLIRPDFSTRILAEVKDVRTTILSEFIKICKKAMDHTLQQATSDCGDELCPAVRAGVVLQGFHSAGLNPLPENTSALEGSIWTYWQYLKTIDFDYRIYSVHRLCGVSSEVGHKGSLCGDFGITAALQITLKQHTHKRLWEQYELE